MALDCENCEFACNGYTNRMMGNGGRKVDIMIVGNNPDRDADQEGEAFAGVVGDKLRWLMKRAGLKWSNTYKTYAIKCIPTKGKKVAKKHVEACEYWLHKEIIKVKPKLIFAMGDVACRMLIDEESVFDNRGFFEKFILDYDVKVKGKKKLKEKTFECMIMPTHNVAGTLVKWENEDIIIHDLKKGLKYIETGKLPKTKKINVTSVLDLKTLNKVEKILLNSKDFSFDFETTGLDFSKHDIICSIFSPNAKDAYVVPLLEYPKEIYEKFDEENQRFAKKINKFVKKYAKEIWAMHVRVFKSKVPKSAHNGKFDSKFGRKHKFSINMKSYTEDTCIKHSVVDENKPHGLTFILEWFGFVQTNYEKELWPYVGKTKKNKKSYINIPPKILHGYGGYDGCGVQFLLPILKKWAEKEGVEDLYYKQQMPYMRMLYEIEYDGLKIDRKEMNRLSKDFQKMLNDSKTAAQKLIKNPEFNPGSPKQLVKFFEDKGAPIIKKSGSGGFSTAEDVLMKYANKEVPGIKKSVQQMSRHVLDFRKITKLKSTYLDGKDGDGGIFKWVGPGDMIHYESNVHTPRTGRISISNPPLHGIPRFNPRYPMANIRTLFIPVHDYIGSIDYAQLEMRIVAFLSRDRMMLKEIKNKVDIHSRNIVMFGTALGFLPKDLTEKRFIEIKDYEPPDAWEKLSGKKKEKIEEKIEMASIYYEFRVLAKTIGFGLNYGKTAYSIGLEFGRDQNEVQTMIDMYFDKYNMLLDWREEMKELWLEKGVITLPMTGRKRRLTANRWFNCPYGDGYWSRDNAVNGINRQAMNFPVQGLANEIFTAGGDYKGGIIKLHNRMKKNNMQSKILLPIHDGVLVDVKKHEAKKLRDMANKILPRTLGAGKKHEVTLTVDIDFYDRWQGKKVKI